MRKHSLCTIAFFLYVSLAISFTAWAVPPVINYEGKLAGTDGSALNGYYSMQFYLYDAETKGLIIWGPESYTVSVTDGLFSVQLGDTVPFPQGLFDYDDLYLEMRILHTATGWETLSPRLYLTSCAYALKARDAETIGGKSISDLVTMGQADSVTVNSRFLLSTTGKV